MKLQVYVVAIFLTFTATNSISAQGTGFWEAIPGLDFTVDILRSYGNDLLVGGLFDSAGGNTNARHIAKWNGASWEALGTGINEWVTSIAVNGNDVYVGGAFDSAGGVINTNKIARWDGTNWNSVGGGLNFSVVTLLFENDKLYAGGSFRNAGGNGDADRIAIWNGANWEAMDKGFNNSVYTIAINNGEIYAGGIFSAAGADTNVKFIAKWNDVDSLWEPFGNGLNHQVHHIGFNNDEMYIGGYFTDAGGDPNADRIAKWNGTSWEGLGPGLNGNYDLAEVEEFAFDGDDIYVAGQFNIIGEDSTFFNIAKWNGSTWEKMGMGVDQVVRSLVIHNDDLFIGGAFNTVVPGGFDYLPFIAKRSNITSIINDDFKGEPNNFNLHQNYPNPFNPTTKISWQSSIGSWQTLKVYDVLGNEIATLINEEIPSGSNEVVFDAFALPSGVYFYQLNVNGFHQIRKMLLLK